MSKLIFYYSKKDVWSYLVFRCLVILLYLVFKVHTSD